jgi:hypothetical protein
MLTTAITARMTSPIINQTHHDIPPPVMVRDKTLVAVPPRLSLTLKVIEADLTAAVGLPEITPAELRERPAGKVPVCTEKV